MIFLPQQKTQVSKLQLACAEKIMTYISLYEFQMPVLHSVLLNEQDLKHLTPQQEQQIQQHLGGAYGMVRYIYHHACHHVKNGGFGVLIDKQSLQAVVLPEADLWLLSYVDRTQNIWSANILLQFALGMMQIEVVGKGFDVSDINKGSITPHQIIQVPYPIIYGQMYDWWKWANIHICTQAQYEQSIQTRIKRLRMWNTEVSRTHFDDCYHPLDLCCFHQIFEMVSHATPFWEGNKLDFCNLSCSYNIKQKLIFWDIQTSQGKQKAYLAYT